MSEDRKIEDEMARGIFRDVRGNILEGVPKLIAQRHRTAQMMFKKLVNSVNESEQEMESAIASGVIYTDELIQPYDLSNLEVVESRGKLPSSTNFYTEGNVRGLKTANNKFVPLDDFILDYREAIYRLSNGFNPSFERNVERPERLITSKINSTFYNTTTILIVEFGSPDQRELKEFFLIKNQIPGGVRVSNGEVYYCLETDHDPKSIDLEFSGIVDRENFPHDDGEFWVHAASMQYCMEPEHIYGEEYKGYYFAIDIRNKLNIRRGRDAMVVAKPLPSFPDFMIDTFYWAREGIVVNKHRVGDIDHGFDGTQYVLYEEKDKLYIVAKVVEEDSKNVRLVPIDERDLNNFTPEDEVHDGSIFYNRNFKFEDFDDYRRAYSINRDGYYDKNNSPEGVTRRGKYIIEGGRVVARYQANGRMRPIMEYDVRNLEKRGFVDAINHLPYRIQREISPDRTQKKSVFSPERERVRERVPERDFVFDENGIIIQDEDDEEYVYDDDVGIIQDEDVGDGIIEDDDDIVVPIRFKY